MKDSYILVRVPVVLKKKAQLLAKIKFTSLSELVRQLLVTELDEQKKKRG